MRLHAHGKINWTLNILGKRPDGYHEMDMLLQSVSLYDVIALTPADTLTMEVAGGRPMRTDDQNLVMKAALALSEAVGTNQGAHLVLDKRIPVGAGMGGGSADAAAVLVGLNALWGLGLSMERLAVIGKGIGADVPFCVRGGLQRAQGIGEVLTPLRVRRSFWLVVVQPCRGLSTKDVFTALRVDEIVADQRPDNDGAARALARGDLQGLCGAMGNVLEPVAAALRPEIGQCIRQLTEQGAIKAMMTGSGSAVFGVFATAKEGRGAMREMRRRYKAVWMVRTEEAGVTVVPETPNTVQR